MGWNDPKNSKSPWNGEKKPPDLDEALRRFQEKLKKKFTGGRPSRGPTLTEPPENAGILVVMGLVALFLIWMLSGIFIVDPAEQAAILRFGRYVETVGPGPHWILRFVNSKIRVNVDRVSDYSYSANMLTEDENLVSVSVAVQYRIGDLKDYLFNVTNPEESLKQATSSALRQVVGKTTLDQMITEGREAWGIHVQDTLIKILDRYKTGITIVNVSPQPARAPEAVQDAFDDAIKAQEDEKRFKEQAAAYQARVVPIAEGNAKRIMAAADAEAKQTVLRAKGNVAAFSALLPAYIKAPFITSQRLYFEALEHVFQNTQKVLIDSQSPQVLYLPLDKLGKSIASSPALMNKPNVSATTLLSPAIPDLVGDRPTIRQSREGGE